MRVCSLTISTLKTSTFGLRSLLRPLSGYRHRGYRGYRDYSDCRDYRDCTMNSNEAQGRSGVEAEIKRNPHRNFKEVEAARPAFEAEVNFHQTRTVKPDWKVGEYSWFCSCEGGGPLIMQPFLFFFYTLLIAIMCTNLRLRRKRPFLETAQHNPNQPVRPRPLPGR